MAYLHIYKNNPTAGGTDGTQVSEGTQLAPLTIDPLNATINEVSDPIKLALRCDAGYVTADNIVLSMNGANASKWAFSEDNNGTPLGFLAYGAWLTLIDPVDATNTVFWIKAKSTSDENPQNDVSTKIHVACYSVVAV